VVGATVPIGRARPAAFTLKKNAKADVGVQPAFSIRSAIIVCCCCRAKATRPKLRKPTNFRANSGSCGMRWSSFSSMFAGRASCAPVRFYADFISRESGRWRPRRRRWTSGRPDDSGGAAEVGAPRVMFRAGYQAEQKAGKGRAGGGGAGRKCRSGYFLGHLLRCCAGGCERPRGEWVQHQDQRGESGCARVGGGDLPDLFGLLAWSYFGNRALEQESLAASGGIPASEGAGGAVAGIDSLQNLDTVRQSLTKLTAYERDGAPLSLRWVFIKVARSCPTSAKYTTQVRQLLFGATQAQMFASMQRSPLRLDRTTIMVRHTIL